MPNLTANLNKWIAELEGLVHDDSVRKAALGKMLELHRIEANEILWKHAADAIERTQEYNIPAFKVPLKAAIMDERSIYIDYRPNGTLITFVNLDETAGDLQQYVEAVNSVRETESDPQKASWYWRNFIYGQAREGFVIKQKRKEGQRGRTPLRRQEGKDLYYDTINARIEAMSSPAPFWGLINDGNHTVPGLGRGGFPYPKIAPTNFVEYAEAEIRVKFTGYFKQYLEEYRQRLEMERYGESGILQSIVNAIQGVEDGYVWSPTGILLELQIKGRQYEVYRTRTGRIGMRLSR